VVSNHKLQKMVKVKLNFKITQFTELTDAQWAMIQKIIDTGRKIQKDLRMIFNCIIKITRTGCQWRNIDEKYRPWQSIYYYFRKWTKKGVLGDLLSHLVKKERVRQGRKPEATAAAIDSQSVKKVSFIHLDTGMDGNKKINGRKRNILVDTLGLPLAIFVCAANIQDGIAGIELLPLIDNTTEQLTLIRADKAYRSDFTEAAQWCGYTTEVSQKPPTEKGFVPQTGRWQVERSFAWENFYRRLSKDFEKTVESSVSFIQLSFISIILSKF
jgi:putative transposase